MGRSSPFSVSNFPLPTPHRGLMPGPYFPGAIAAAPSTLLPSPVLRKHLHLRAAPSTLLPSPVLRKHLHLRDAEGGGIRNSPGAEHQNISSECHALLSNGVLGGCSKIVQVVTALDPSSNRFHSSLLGSTEQPATCTLIPTLFVPLNPSFSPLGVPKVKGPFSQKI